MRSKVIGLKMLPCSLGFRFAEERDVAAAGNRDTVGRACYIKGSPEAHENPTHWTREDRDASLQGRIGGKGQPLTEYSPGDGVCHNRRHFMLDEARQVQPNP